MSTYRSIFLICLHYEIIDFFWLYIAVKNNILHIIHILCGILYGHWSCMKVSAHAVLSLFTLLQSVSGLSLINSLIIIWLFPCVCLPLCYMNTCLCHVHTLYLSHMLPLTISRETGFFTSCIMCSTGQSFTFLFPLKLTPFFEQRTQTFFC